MGAIDQALVTEVFQSYNLNRPTEYRKFSRIKGKYKAKVKRGERLAEDSMEEVSSWNEIVEIAGATKDSTEIEIKEGLGTEFGEGSAHDEVKFSLRCLEEYSEANKGRFIRCRYRLYNSIPPHSKDNPRTGQQWGQFFETQEGLQILTQLIKAAGMGSKLDPKSHNLTDTNQIPNAALIGERVKITYELVFDPETNDEEGRVTAVFPAPQS